MLIRNLVLVALLAVPAVTGAQERLAFVAIEPCRLVDTRVPLAGPGGPTGPLVPGQVAAVPVGPIGDLCGIPVEARAIQANVTATATKGAGFLSIMKALPGPVPVNPQPQTSLLNYSQGQTVANAATVSLWWQDSLGYFWVVAGGAGTDIVVDVTGYYVAF